ncbi:hypothetical protein BDV97DRAFT_412908 [Delphinella strobiligena]|nr:hypothetical protein BDV97DRAFT_412908 [Delphinella strobiligena]
MRFAIAASALFAGLAAAVPAVTMTAYSTDVDTVISCAADVTNCPGRTSSTAVASTPAEATSVPAVTTAAPFPSAGNATTPSQSTIYLYSTDILTITSCAATVTNCPARTSLTSSIVGTSVVPVAPVAAPSSSETGAVGVPSAAPYPIASNGTVPAWVPSGTGAASASGSGASASPPAYTGAGNQLNAGMALAGVGAFAALLL